MKEFRTYQLAMELSKQCARIRLKEPYRNQFERAVLSICLNLAEGNAKSSAKERRRFFEIALGSIREVQTIIELKNLSQIQSLCDRLAASAYCLCRALRPL